MPHWLDQVCTRTPLTLMPRFGLLLQLAFYGYARLETAAKIDRLIDRIDSLGLAVHERLDGRG